MRKVIEYFEKLPEEKWEVAVGSNWNIKDVVAHLIAWNYEAASEIERVYEEGGEPWFMGTDKVDEFNANAVQKYTDFSPEELVAELKKSDIEVEKAIEKCGEDNLRNRPAFKWLFESDTKKPHAVKHLDKIKETLGE